MNLTLLRVLMLLAGIVAFPAHASLDRIEIDETVSVEGFTYGPGKAFAGDIHLRRIDVYAPDARVFVIGPNGPAEIPRSDLRLFVADRDREAQRLYLAVSADGKRFEGAVFDADGTRAIAGEVIGDALRVERSELVEDESRPFSCAGSPEPPAAASQELSKQLARIAAADNQLQGAATRQAVIAIDTDNQFMELKFANNSTNANNYIAALMAGMNVFYERDLNVRLQLGTVFLRPSTTTDPYPSGTDSDIGAQLNEFGEYWRVTPSLGPGTVPRAFAAQLSGKLSSNFSASGIAWLLTGGNYCSATGQVFGNGTFGHYSVTRVFKFNGATAANDVAIVGHELGHNFGAAHTHCSSSVNGGVATNANQVIDRCFNAETISGGVCHSGTPSCPTDNSISGRGSLMSYCNFPSNQGGANCGAVLQEFHPAHQSFLGGRITQNFNNGCITAVVGNVGPLLAAQSPANNSSTAMGGGVIGTPVTRNITFTASGGSGNGTTQLTCSVGSGTVSIASGSPQTISVNGSANPVVARFTLLANAQQGVVNCSAVRQGAATVNFSYTFTASAGTPPSLNRIFCSGFESGQTGVCI